MTSQKFSIFKRPLLSKILAAPLIETPERRLRIWPIKVFVSRSYYYRLVTPVRWRHSNTWLS